MRCLSSLSISYKTANVDLIERARLPDPDLALRRLASREGVSEAMLLQTCNRVELYTVSGSPDLLAGFARDEGLPSEAMTPASDEGCMRAMMRLACGLESMIVGEDQVLGQLKAAYLHAEKNRTMGPVLSAVVMKAIHTGRRARAETKINKGSVSIGSAAVDLAEAIAGGLRGKTILVVGAGEMGTLVARAIAEKSLRAIYVANRTFEQAEKLASSLQGTAVRLDRIEDYISSADVIICATGAPHIIITRKMIERNRNGHPLLVIDIANPRNVETAVGELPGVTLHNIDSLRRISDANLETRRAEAAKVELIIEEEMALLNRDLKRMQADSVIGGLYRKTDSIRAAELDYAITRLTSAGGLSEKQVGILRDFSAALTGKILAVPTRKLRLAAERSDEDCLRVAQDLFDLKGEEEDVVSSHKAKALKAE
ncbi:MAG: Glutamyl-tRNA reductase [Methanocella sp. PtaU1.Bin125]|nr:MAG: Glutamyl-tRNA reductase [Methanocella sp. PtaU1.Bin125]